MYSIQRSVFGVFVEKAIDPSVPPISINHVFVSPGAARARGRRDPQLGLAKRKPKQLSGCNDSGSR